LQKGKQRYNLLSLPLNKMQMKARTLVLIILLVIAADQALKIWVKTHMPITDDWNEYHTMLTPYDRGIRPFGGDWCQISFTENDGMAWGWKFGGEWGKIALTLFRLIAVIAGVFILRSFIRQRYHKGFIICAGLIFAGALGNLIDSLFYGLIFEESTHFHVAKMFPQKGYASFLHGKVVDMFYFPIIKDKQLPSWIPFWGGERFTFFNAVFNIADAAISVGVITILLFQKRFFKNKEEGGANSVETNTPVNDNTQVS
jgi:signal peptidase II